MLSRDGCTGSSRIDWWAGEFCGCSGHELRRLGANSSCGEKGPEGLILSGDGLGDRSPDVRTEEKATDCVGEGGQSWESGAHRSWVLWVRGVLMSLIEAAQRGSGVARGRWCLDPWDLHVAFRLKISLRKESAQKSQTASKVTQICDVSEGSFCHSFSFKTGLFIFMCMSVCLARVHVHCVCV